MVVCTCILYKVLIYGTRLLIVIFLKPVKFKYLGKLLEQDFSYIF